MDANKSVEEKAVWIQEKLDTFYPDPPIPLDHSDAYSLLVAVLLSAQCTDIRVNQVTPQLFEKADNPFAMSKLDVLDIEAIIKPCGIAKNKSKAIKKLSEMLVENHGGEVPNSMAELEKLPGVGHKTASVVMIQAFGQAAFPVDTHIHRCAERWGLSDGKNVKKTEEDLKALFPKGSWAKLHLQMIWFGREVCKARGHVDADCPVCSVVR